jgi:hypothetical protein
VGRGRYPPGRVGGAEPGLAASLERRERHWRAPPSLAEAPRPPLASSPDPSDPSDPALAFVWDEGRSPTISSRVGSTTRAILLRAAPAWAAALLGGPSGLPSSGHPTPAPAGGATPSGAVLLAAIAMNAPALLAAPIAIGGSVAAATAWRGAAAMEAREERAKRFENNPQRWEN